MASAPISASAAAGQRDVAPAIATVAASPSAPPPALSLAAKPGWSRDAPGVWSFSTDEGEAPELSLRAEGEGRGGYTEGEPRLVQVFELPPGARRARVAKIWVAYLEPGEVTWTVQTARGSGKESILGQLEVTVANESELRAPPQWVEHDLGGVAVEGKFGLVFARRSGYPLLGGLPDATFGDLFQLDPALEAPVPVRARPFVRLQLVDVDAPAEAQSSPRLPAPQSDADCASRPACAKHALCTARDGVCIVGKDRDCAANATCRDDGHCKAKKGRCVVRDLADCRKATACPKLGLCGMKEGLCAAVKDSDCEAAWTCGENGHCAKFGYSCGATHSGHCEQSRACKERGLCAYGWGNCVPRKPGPGVW